MQLSNLITLLHTVTGFSADNKVVFNEIPTGEKVSLPYMNVQTPTTYTFGADNITYYQSPNANIELYTKRKDTVTEGLVETLLTNNGIYYTKYEGRIDAQSCYQVVYEIGV